MKTISFDRIKDILVSNVPAISQRIFGDSAFPLAAHSLIGALRSYMDGKPVRATRVAAMVEDKIREFIRGADVRCLGDLLELLPKGYDNRLPGWLYGPVEAWLGEEGWAIMPKAA